MRKIFGILLFALCCTTASAQQSQDKLPPRAEILKSAISVNDYFMKKYEDYTTPSYKGIFRPSNIWTRGVYYEGLMALYSIYPRENYYKYTLDWAEFHKWGFRNGNTTRNADDHCAAQAYIEMNRLSPCPKKLRNTLASVQMLLNTPQVDDWTWIDAIQMAMPIMAMLGKDLNDTRYFDKMWEMYAHSRNVQGGNGLFNTKDGLWWRDKGFVPPHVTPNGKSCYWSRGNGWVYAALVRVLKEIPTTETHHKEYMNDFLAMSEALKTIQRTDGFWNVDLGDPNHFGGKEVTGTSLFVYGMAYGINNGLLDRNVYLPIITKAWNAMVKDCIHPNGFLGYVQGTGKEPKDSQPVTYDGVPDFEDYGIGCFLLAASEVYKIKP